MEHIILNRKTNYLNLNHETGTKVQGARGGMHLACMFYVSNCFCFVPE